jgi:hypothetical protein
MYFDKLHAPLITILATFQAVGFLQAEEITCSAQCSLHRY